ncbi:MAG: Orotidine 5'-phosphate decarboxylase [Candidatus Rifleibacterium amylolyticum]|nr:MAG: Orotidine 5'-phosphate decarboxylase [Candidatus Rifleibacterium amylolyticum]
MMNNKPAKIFKLIPALDVLELANVEHIARIVGNNEMFYGFKAGFSLGLTHGLGKVVETIRRYSDLPIIYDHQKAATDIPDTGRLFAQTLRRAGINEAILFPQAGPVTLEAWISALREEELKVIVGGLMTHKAYMHSEGGFLNDQAIETIYRTAVDLGVNSFVVPLTKPEAVDRIFQTVPFRPETEFYSPGYGRQGGDPSRFASIARHYLIVGRALLEAADPVAWIADASTQLRSAS